MFAFGACYYPEQVPESFWETDAKLMREAGFTVVRLAEFAWSRLEPSDGVFDFSWLDRVIDLLGSNGITIILGTPTAAAPPWMFSDEMALVEANGLARIWGSRREYCPNSPLYHHYSVRITRAMAEHYRDNPHVIGWQIDNEFGERCYCARCRSAFQSWLQRKFGSLDSLNERWGTVFWSHTYTAWDQIPAPWSRVHAPHNPGLLLDYARFMSDSYVDYQQQQLTVLRDRCPNHFVTHNFTSFYYENINYFDLARPLDFVSLDNYPRGFWDLTLKTPAAAAAIAQVTMRSLKHRPFWVMEQQSGVAAWNTFSSSVRPGEVRLWAYQSIAHGADGIVFFRWRSARFGVEQFWQGILDHDGIPGRRYDEIKRMGAELQRIGSFIQGAEVRSEVALMMSYDSRFAFQIQPHHPEFSYASHLVHYFNALHGMHIAAEMVSPDDTFSSYKLVIVTALLILDQQTVSALLQFVEQGGIVLVTMRSGVKDQDNQVVDMPMPGLLSTLCGIEIEECDALPPQETRQLNFVDAKATTEARASIWCDIIRPTQAEVIATYGEDYYEGRAAVTLNRIGKGSVLYMGTAGSEALIKTVTEIALDLAQVRSVYAHGSSDGTEITVRWQGERRFLFVLNHGRETSTVRLDKTYTDLLSGQVFTEVVQITPRQVLILTEDS
ncbi:MAG: beta-galactosidase [Chloroflexota bacterium]|nr:beta-galactosidase [Chloroflexota bacterium]